MELKRKLELNFMNLVNNKYFKKTHFIILLLRKDLQISREDWGTNSQKVNYNMVP